MKDVKELAIAISQLDFAAMENGMHSEHDRFHAIRCQVMQMEKADAIHLLFEVMQAKVLNLQYPKSIFAELLKFDRMYHAYLSFKPSGEQLPASNDDPDLWHDLAVKIDTMARYRDNKHFGLPMGEITDLIEPLRQQYLLRKK